MKIYPICNIIFLVSALFLSARSGLAADQGTGGVTIKEDAIVIHPGTKLSKDDEKALSDVLKKYDKKLYRVDKIKKGKLPKSIGDLKIDAKMESELAKAKMAGNTDNAVLFVSGAQTLQHIPIKTGAALTQKENAQKLIQELKPVLEKYSKP